MIYSMLQCLPSKIFKVAGSQLNDILSLCRGFKSPSRILDVPVSFPQNLLTFPKAMFVVIASENHVLTHISLIMFNDLIMSLYYD